MCEFQEQVAKHHILSRSSSEPVQGTRQSTHTREHTATVNQSLERDKTNADSPEDDPADTHKDDNVQTETVTESTQTQEKPDLRVTVIKGKNEIPETLVSTKEDTIMKTLESEEEHTDTLRWAMLHVGMVWK